MVLVVGVAIGIAVLVHGNQLPPFQSFDCFLERRFFDPGVTHDGIVGGPAVPLAAGTADQVGVQLELRGIQRHIEDFIG